MKTLPRLEHSIVQELVEQLAGVDSPDATAVAALQDQYSRFVTLYAAGGTPATREELRALRERVVDCARSCGFPNTRADAQFDRQCSRILFNNELLKECYPGELWRDETWSALTCCYLLDVALWRFKPSRQRLGGGNRNVFQRLWLRAKLLHQGGRGPQARWHLLDKLSEDAAVALFERTAMLGNPRLIQAIATVWCAMRAELPATVAENVMRAAMIRIGALNELYLLEQQSDADRICIVRQVFAEVRQQFAGDCA